MRTGHDCNQRNNQKAHRKGERLLIFNFRTETVTRIPDM